MCSTYTENNYTKLIEFLTVIEESPWHFFLYVETSRICDIKVFHA